MNDKSNINNNKITPVDKLENSIHLTYKFLRMGIAIIGVSLPIVLYLVGLMKGIGLQDSISAYFHAEEGGYLLRTIFVGLLFIIGAALILYEGYTSKENWLLNFAGIFIILVALFPMTWEKNGVVLFQGAELINSGNVKVGLHGIFAIAFFACIAFVCILCPSETLEGIQNEEEKKQYKLKYKKIGWAMLLLPLFAGIASVVTNSSHYIVFILEVAAIFPFVYYWWEKGKEIEKTKEEHIEFRKRVMSNPIVKRIFQKENKKLIDENKET